MRRSIVKLLEQLESEIRQLESELDDAERDRYRFDKLADERQDRIDELEAENESLTRQLEEK